MQFTRMAAVLVFLVSSFVTSNVFAQAQNNDYCQRHPEIFDPKSGSWDLPEMRDCLYGGSHEDFTSFPNRSPCG